VITIYADRSFTFEMKTPPMSFFLKQAAKIQSGSKAPGRDKAGQVTKAQVREIAEKKMKDLELRLHRVGHEDGRGLRPFDGS
jgi:large subunit ribosomal protein L11